MTARLQSFILGIVLFLPNLFFDLDDPIGIPQEKPSVVSAYDFIVVGAGSAGSVVAARLANAGKSVLVLEAGSDGSLLTEIPAAVGATLGSSLDWQFLTEPDNRACLGSKNGQCLWHAGKVVGGGSTVNGMLYVRGDREDYDAWERRGNPGWGWKDVLPFFKASEDQLNPYYARDSLHHSVGGPLPVGDVAFKTPLSDAFLNAGKRQGFPVRDINTGNATGFTFMQANIKRGKRQSTAKAFLRPSLQKGIRLTVLTEARVDRLVWEGRQTPKVAGVVYKRRGELKRVWARKEVIISAGVVGSPKLLLLSGIGPRQDLARLGIPLVADLPVGQNMQSHVGTGEAVFTLEEKVSFNPLRLFANPINLLAYIRGEGPLASVSGFEGMAIYRSGLDTSTSWPDVQLSLISVTPGVDGGLVYRRSLNMGSEMFSKWKPLALKEGFTILPVIVHPRSRGTLSLRSRDPSAPPLIRPNYFSDPLDMAVMIQAVKFSLALGTSPPFARYGSRFYDRPIEFCTKQGLRPYSDAYWDCAIRWFTYPLYHDACTCPMGPKSDNQAVVDSRLRVHGVYGLRVADASIMPNLVSGNTNAACIMIGEKASALIREDWGI